MAECFHLLFNGLLLLPAPLRVAFAVLLFGSAMLFAMALHRWLEARKHCKDADFWGHVPSSFAVALVVMWGSWSTLSVCTAVGPVGAPQTSEPKVAPAAASVTEADAPRAISPAQPAKPAATEPAKRQTASRPHPSREHAPVRTAPSPAPRASSAQDTLPQLARIPVPQIVPSLEPLTDADAAAVSEAKASEHLRDMVLAQKASSGREATAEDLAAPAADEPAPFESAGPGSAIHLPAETFQPNASYARGDAPPAGSFFGARGSGMPAHRRFGGR